MSKLKKLTLLFIGGLFVLLAAIAVALVYFVGTDAYKPRLQAAVAEALDMEVSIKGRLGVDLYPGIGLSMDDVRVRNQGKELVVVEKARVGLEIFSIFRNEVGITNVKLIRPKITIERGVDGKYNFDTTKTDVATTPAVSLAKISLLDGRFVYVDKGSGGKIDASGCSLVLRDLSSTGKAIDVMQDISFRAKLNCSKILANSHTITDLECTVNAKEGVFDFKPITLHIFRGKGSGSLLADYSGPVPRYRVGFVLPQFYIEELIKTQSPQKILEGPMDFSMKLSLQGKTAQQIRQGATGDVVVQGSDLKLYGHDLDLEFDRYESSQNFSLLDMGALFVAGPVGMAVTKGHDFANVIAGSGGVSDIRTLVSRWGVKHGVMHAQDVAMATNRHRMAFLGSLDFVHSNFVDVTLALINNQGCAEVQQQISGPFERPLVHRPNVLKSVAGPVLKLIKKGRSLLPGGGCKVIYSGAVAPPP